MELDVRRGLLQEAGLFADLDAAAVSEVARSAHERPLKRGETPFRQGDPAAHAYVVAWGRVRLEQQDVEGNKVIIRYLGAGDMLGTVAVLRGGPYPATPTAVEDTMLLAWSAPRLAALMADHPRIATNGFALVGARLEELQQRLTEVAHQRVERRIAATLLRLVRQSGRQIDGGIEIPFDMSRENLADLAATTLHTVSRTLGEWERGGLVEARRSKRLVILRPEALVQLAEPPDDSA
jgi:CRP-like cAMP-binding protein